MQPSNGSSTPRTFLLLLLFASLPGALLGAGCGDDDEDPDAGPLECPVAAPEVGSSCDPDLGNCVYRGLNRECPPLVGTCECVQGGWVCESPECSDCDRCGDDCCEGTEVCRAGEGGLSQACGPRGVPSTPIFGECGHESDCAGVEPICSPICDNLCCTTECDRDEDCEEGFCGDNGVCEPDPEEG